MLRAFPPGDLAKLQYFHLEATLGQRLVCGAHAADATTKNHDSVGHPSADP